jgi:hypothetical protein
MRGREFLDLARAIVSGPTEAYRRGTVIHAYYALVLECRDALARWGFACPPRRNVHSWVRLRFVFATDADCKVIGSALDFLGKRRNEASYLLSLTTPFATDFLARRAIHRADSALALLEAIDTDPARRAAAIASLPP